MIQDRISQGAEANRQGDNLHLQVGAWLVNYGFTNVTLTASAPENIKELPTHLPKLLFKTPGVMSANEIVGQTLYRTPLCCNYLLYRDGWPTPLALFARHQKGSGSTRERLPYLYGSIYKHSDCPTILLLDGPEMITDAVYEYAVSFAASSKGRILRVFRGLHSFGQWGKDGCFYPQPTTPALF